MDTMDGMDKNGLLNGQWTMDGMDEGRGTRDEGRGTARPIRPIRLIRPICCPCPVRVKSV